MNFTLDMLVNDIFQSSLFATCNELALPSASNAISRKSS